jgi:hypothetical protein
MAIFNVGNRIIEPGTWPWGYDGCKELGEFFDYSADPIMQGSTATTDSYATYNAASENISVGFARKQQAIVYHEIQEVSSNNVSFSFEYEDNGFSFDNYGSSGFVGLGNANYDLVGVKINFDTDFGYTPAIYPVVRQGSDSAYAMGPDGYSISSGGRYKITIESKGSSVTVTITDFVSNDLLASLAVESTLDPFVCDKMLFYRAGLVDSAGAYMKFFFDNLKVTGGL